MSTAEYLKPHAEEEEDEQEIVDSSSITAIEEADRSHMIRTAKANPRSATKFIEELTAIACHSQETAMEMMYSIPRDGKQLIGPSIGFAEAALAVWGNARAGSEVIETNAGEGYVVAEGRYYDCEKNVGRAIRKRRRIVAKRITPDAIQVTGDAACSIAAREAILRSIPKPLWKPIWNKARETASGSIKSVEAVRLALVDAFHKMGVTDIQILNALGVAGLPDMGADEIIALQSWKNQLRDGAAVLEDIFGAPEDAEIELCMKKLGWNQAKMQQAWEVHKGQRPKLLEYVRAEVKKQEAANPVKMDEQPQTTETKAPVAETKTSEPETKAAEETPVKTVTEALKGVGQAKTNGNGAPKQNKANLF